MTALFTDKINTLNQEIANLQQELESKQQAISSLEQLNSNAASIIDRLSELVPNLDPDGKSTLKTVILEVFENGSNPDPDSDPDRDLTSQDKNANVEKTSNEVDNSTNEFITNNDKTSETIESIVSQESLPERNSPTKTTREELSDKYVLNAQKITEHIYQTNQNGAIVSLKNRSKLEAWGKYFVSTMKICDRYHLISGSRCITPYKHELHLLGIDRAKLNQLVNSNIDFKVTPEKFFAPVTDNSTEQITPPPIASKFLTLALLPENFNAGDIAKTERGEYEVIEVIDNTNQPSLQTNNRPDYLVKCICLKHNSNSSLIGKTVNVPLDNLTNVVKGKKSEAQQVELEEGIEVKIISDRKGQELNGKIGIITNASSDGCAIKINDETHYFFCNEIIPVSTDPVLNNNAA